MFVERWLKVAHGMTRMASQSGDSRQVKRREKKSLTELQDAAKDSPRNNTKLQEREGETVFLHVVCVDDVIREVDSTVVGDEVWFGMLHGHQKV